MSLRAALLFEIARRRLPPPARRTIDYGAYQDWRRDSLSRSWSAFSEVDLGGKDVLDFGCGDGALAFYLATEKHPRSVVGVDLSAPALERARRELSKIKLDPSVEIKFVQGNVDGLPLPDSSVDIIAAFDCLEHVMSPLAVLKDWHRVLRPGGRCVLEWFPYKGPWGPHMESLIPVPWAHVLFGQEAMFRAAERIYELEEFVPRHWDLDEQGNKKPNKWIQWSSFREQGYINELDLSKFLEIVHESGLRIARLEEHSFGGSAFRRGLGRMLAALPWVGEYFVSFTVIELVRPTTHSEHVSH
ncbi:MAG: class I SAM-dependent methyltransferase [Actinobacteria bacterium]|nr:class I SAM-dependent methyltransferase [Actinomycetota bacterium]